MNKTELIKHMASKSGLSQAQAGAALDAFCDVIKDELAHAGEVNIIGFGAFGVTERSARQGRNPSTGEMIDIPACQVVKFKAGKGLKDAVRAD